MFYIEYSKKGVNGKFVGSWQECENFLNEYIKGTTINYDESYYILNYNPICYYGGIEKWKM